MNEKRNILLPTIGIAIIVIFFLAIKLWIISKENKKLINQVTVNQKEIKDYEETYKFAFSYLNASVVIVPEKNDYKVGDSSRTEVFIGSTDMVYKDNKLFKPYIVYELDGDSVTENGGPYDTLVFQNQTHPTIAVKTEKIGKHIINGALILPKPWKPNDKYVFPFSYTFNLVH